MVIKNYDKLEMVFENLEELITSFVVGVVHDPGKAEQGLLSLEYHFISPVKSTG